MSVKPQPPSLCRWSAPIAVIVAVLLWRRQHDAFYAAEPSAEERTCIEEHPLLRLASVDWLLLGYLLMLLARVLANDGPLRSHALTSIGVVLVAYVAILWKVRWGSADASRSAWLLYRLGMLIPLIGTFVELEWILPAASGPPLDEALRAFDLRVFGVEPAVAWDRFVAPPITEWFSFFYYGYFILISLHIFPALFFGRDPKFLTTFGFGFLWLYCVGHVVYTIVPAYGPYANLAFHHSLEGARWWPLVQRTVAAGGARTDVFPSLHTAGPAYLALYSFLNRCRAPFKFTWFPLAFCSSQIVIATMFLRWHYLIDIFAGLALASSAVLAGRLAYAWDVARVEGGGAASWPALGALKCPHLSD